MPLAWVTGAHGFIGRYLSRSLHASRYRVTGIGHGAWPDSEAAHWGISQWLNGEISASNLGQLKRSSGTPDIVFHLAGGSSVGAAMTHPYEDFKRTVGSTAELLEWIRQYSPDTRILAVSSAAVYGSDHHGPIAETASLHPFSPYGTHKLMMEEQCRSYAENYGLRVVLPRLFSVYGPGLKKQLLWDLCSKFSRGGVVELGGGGGELRDWTDVRDVVSGLEKVAQLASTDAPVLNLASGMATAVRDMAATVGAVWASSESTVLVTFSGNSRPGDPFSLVADIAQLRTYGIELGGSLAQGVEDYVAWYRTHMKVAG